MAALSHQPVLLNEVIAGLAIRPNGIYVDATFGRGGHSRAILQQLNEQGRLLAFDQDPAALSVVKQDPFCDPRFELVSASFATLKKEIERRHWVGKVNGVLLDLGVSSPQLDDAMRGFSFTKEGPLDMRMNPNQGVSAADWLNQASADDIRDVLKTYGEEKFAGRIANAIVREREVMPFKTTSQLSHLISKVVPKKELHKHPATRTFQAIRIQVNRELEALEQCLPQCLEIMSAGGRMCVISFHSLEDRMVKTFIQRETKGDDYPPDLPIKEKDLNRRLRKVGKFITPSSAEVKDNPRARSAKLRIAEKLQ